MENKPKKKNNRSSEATSMEKETVGTVIKVSKQWWLKVNTKPIRTHSLDGATFPYIIKVTYTVDGTDYIKRKWIHAGDAAPELNSSVKVVYCEEKPRKARIL